MSFVYFVLEEYREKWDMYEFPIENYKKLKQALNK